MKNTIRLSGIIVIAAVMVFLIAGCATTGGSGGGGSTGGGRVEYEDISITITDIPGSEFEGYEMYVAWDDVYAMPLIVRGSTTSLTVSILNQSNNRPFRTPGYYDVILWFRKGGDKSTDIDFIKMSHSVKDGANTIPFSSFSAL